ncbi:MAG: hypothetical protein C0505_15995 [Leptothrix sp. (in: Bacteria)]|nr:hypothetical protein [Leptothrix sp. (in: b-proteobacteria)]
MKRLFISTIAAAALALGAASTQANPTVALYLTMDGSGSIDNLEFSQQVTSYINALNGVFADVPSLYGNVAIGGGVFGGNFTEFFGVQTINNAADLLSLTTAITGLNAGRAGINTGATAIGTAITASANSLTLFETGLGVDLKLIIDVTTDGANNSGAAPGGVALGLTPNPINAVNCLGIGVGADCTWVAGAGTNFGSATNFQTLEDALKTKLRQEFTVPEPGTLAIVGLGLIGLASLRRRQA